MKKNETLEKVSDLVKEKLGHGYTNISAYELAKILDVDWLELEGMKKVKVEIELAVKEEFVKSEDVETFYSQISENIDEDLFYVSGMDDQDDPYDGLVARVIGVKVVN